MMRHFIHETLFAIVLVVTAPIAVLFMFGEKCTRIWRDRK